MKNRESCLHEGALFLEFHMAKNNIEMQRNRNRDGALDCYPKIKSKKGIHNE